MTELEWMEVGQALWGNALSGMAIYITVLSGYLIIAYVAGSEMKVGQLCVVNFIYIGFSLFLILGFYAFAVNASEADLIAYSMTTQRQIPPTGFLGYVVGGFMVLCLGGSLKFMWDIRRDHRE